MHLNIAVYGEELQNQGLSCHHSLLRHMRQHKSKIFKYTIKYRRRRDETDQTRLRNDYVSRGTLNPTHSLTHRRTKQNRWWPILLLSYYYYYTNRSGEAKVLRCDTVVGNKEDTGNQIKQTNKFTLYICMCTYCAWFVESRSLQVAPSNFFLFLLSLSLLSTFLVR